MASVLGQTVVARASSYPLAVKRQHVRTVLPAHIDDITRTSTIPRIRFHCMAGRVPSTALCASKGKRFRTGFRRSIECLARDRQSSIQICIRLADRG
ncbi:hypothetical protein [Chitinasiproducens palmae]|uniref:hypothetical protein n=1 Tax=Chitinasiproducens palmae TaxID=1770053 RepID=UPI001113C3F2|nr:hypothetical protein [Chitinasiproducens palmae]